MGFQTVIIFPNLLALSVRVKRLKFFIFELQKQLRHPYYYLMGNILLENLNKEGWIDSGVQTNRGNNCFAFLFVFLPFA
jgi:hypothetical protein